MEWVEQFRVRREEIARTYDEELRGVDGVSSPAPCDSGTHAWHLYPIQLDPEVLSIDRDTFIKRLRDEGVGTSVHFIPIHYHAYYESRLDYERGSFPVTERFFERAVSLPIYPSMTDGDAMDVVEAVGKLANYYKR
jgi:dTDP-4-amino-4,6-dideoxygalactose transaminase